MAYAVGSIVRVKSTSKSRYKNAIGSVVGYSSGKYDNICKIQLWENKVINIFEDNVEELSIRVASDTTNGRLISFVNLNSSMLICRGHY